MITKSHVDPLEHFLHRREVERERNIPLDDIVPAEARLAVPISADVLRSLILHEANTRSWTRADAIAWDIRRLFGAEAGLDEYDIARWRLDEDEDEDAPARLWPAFDRPREPGDMLLIDLADEARHHGWTPPADIASALERLQDIAAASPIRCEAAAELAACIAFEESQQQHLLREVAKEEMAAIERRYNDAIWAPDATDEQLDAASARYELEHQKWVAERGVKLWPEIYEQKALRDAASEPKRLARIERFKERIAALDRAHRAGWRPLKDYKWPEKIVMAWCAMFGGMRFHFLDDLEIVVSFFESLLPPRPKPRLGPRLLGHRRKL